MVLKTWSGVLLNEDMLPDDWVLYPGVLVGIESVRKRPRGRHR